MEGMEQALPRGARVAHLIETDGPGGAEQVVAALVGEFHRRGYENTVFLPDHGEGWLGERLAGTEAEIVPFALERPLSGRFALWLARRLRHAGAAVAHSHEFTMAFYGACASHLAGVPHVVTMHGRRYWAARERRRVAMRVATSLSGHTVAVSRQLRWELIEDLRLPHTRVELVLNGAAAPDPGRRTVRGELGLSAAEDLMVSVANLYPVKGHRHLLEALALLAVDRPRLHLALAGRGECRDALERQARALGVADRVHFLGLRGDVPNLLHSADLFVLPSLSEGLPMALLEAMLAGTPVVCTAVGEIPAVLKEDRYGLTVPPAEPRALAAAVRRVLDDPEDASLRAHRARILAEREHSVAHMTDAYLALYAAVRREGANPSTNTRPKLELRTGVGPSM